MVTPWIGECGRAQGMCVLGRSTWPVKRWQSLTRSKRKLLGLIKNAVRCDCKVISKEN